MLDVPLDLVLKIYLENLICICKFNFMVQLCGSKFLCCVLLAASLEECKGEGDGLGRERECSKRSGFDEEERVLMDKDKVQNLASFLTEEMEGKCLDTKSRRGLDIGDWRF